MRNRAMISSILGMALLVGCADEIPEPPESPVPMGPSRFQGDDNGKGLSEDPEDPTSESEGNDPTDSSQSNQR